MANNKEMGVLIDKNDPADTQLFEDAMKEVTYISQTSQKFELNAINQSIIKEPKNIKEKTITPQKQNGYCIRTGTEIPFNIEKPLTYDAYKKWSEYGDPDYAEKYCHFTGEPSNGETSVARPIMKKNWKKAKETFNL
ncbi:MAG: hypothetical protein IPP15_05245 [Saprospiraceae bacterium]|uniref:Uncharacterized protein n=1 Tax=Candidatus Opimibacter skivensis TaxID=2982028 RepID=A0A9D7XN36_9BACT|nr:hypothetical protein [Candidatus Opimibacter skivensis]